MKNVFAIFCILLLISIFANASNASEYLDTDQDNAILLKNAVFDTSKQPYVTVKSDFATTSQYSTETEKYYILQFKSNVLEEWKQTVKNTGALFFDYVPNNAFIVRMNSSVRSQVETMDIVQWIGPYQPAYKISPVFSASSISATTNTILDNNVSDIIVMLFDSKHNVQVTSEIQQLNGEIVNNAGEIMRVRIGTSKLSDIAAMTGVSWIEKYVQPVIFNDIAANITNVSYVQNTHGLTGSGQIVAVADTGLDTGVDNAIMHDDIEGRIIQIYDIVGDGAGDVKSGHGTHVAGSILGNGAMSGGTFKGMAPDAQLVFQAIGDANDGLWLPIDFTLLFQQAYNAGAKIHSNSWGSSDPGLYGNYTAESKFVDIFTWNNPDMLIVFAAGNDGSNGTNTVSSPSTSKNALSVGASNSSRMGDNINLIASFSSRGHTDDNRVKPDLVASGTWIISTRSSVAPAAGLWGDYDPYYRYSGGTSMATPLTAGTAALVRQYFVDNESISPSAALIKATLINGAANMSLPTNDQGWGRVDIEKSLFPTLPRTMYYNNSISLTTSQSWNVSYYVTNNSEPLRVTIVWTDYPSATFVGKTLVNDLDLNVTGLDGSYLGNGGDSINNVEQVEIMSPTIGLYTITINGTNVPYGPQPFAIIISGALSSDVNPPVASDEFPTNNSYINNSTTSVSINITDTENGVNLSSIEMSINDNPIEFTNVSITNGYKIENVTSNPYGDGLFNVSVTASDNASNSLTYNWSFTIDTTPPVINITYPTEGLVIRTSTPNLNITTNKTSNIWYRIGNEVNSSEVNETTNLNTTLSQLNDSTQHNITVFARDLVGNLNSTMVNFTIFATPPTISTPIPGQIFYLPQNTTFVNGTTTIGTNVSVYVNGALVNESYPVAGGIFNISGVPLADGTNVINVTAIYNDTTQNYFSTNTSLTVSVGELFEIGDADNITINVQGLVGIAPSFIYFNITGQGNNIPNNISASIVAPASAPPASNITGPAIDFSVPGYENYTFNYPISLTLGYNVSLVGNSNKMVVAWYNESTSTWVSLRSTVNITANTTTANVIHFTVFAPIEDNTPPANITNLVSTGQTTSSITLSWTNFSDTDHIEIWRSNAHITNVTTTSYANSGLSSSTPYNYALRPVDIVGNKGNWSNVTVSTTSASPTTSSSGGGGGGATGEPFENIAVKDVAREYVVKGSSVTYTFKEETNAIKFIKYDAKSNPGEVAVMIEVLKGTSAMVSTPPSGKVYQNMNLWVGMSGYATEKNIANSVVGFKVAKSWITENIIDVSTIKMNRYNEEKWTTLPTTKTGEDATYIYFESQTSGFSPFAITANDRTISSQAFIKSETAAESLQPVEEQPVETATSAPEIESVEETSIWGNLPVGALILSIIAGGYIYARKRQS